MALSPTDFAARDGDRLAFRADPLRLRVELANLSTADRHDLHCIFECSARVGDHSADRQLFVELLLADRPTVSRDDVAIHLRSALESAATAAGAAHPVADLLSETGKSEFLGALRKAADAQAFNSGLIILPPFQLELTSPSYQRQNREAAQRMRVEEQAAGRLDHLRHAADLLKQFDSIRSAAPSISAGQVLERIAPSDRGVLLDALLASNADRAAASTNLYGVAGSSLVKIDLATNPPQQMAIELPATLGPLRSVQPATINGEARLLVGARSGVLLVDPRDPQCAIAYADPEQNSSLGFHRAIYLESTKSIFATHGEAGLVRWDRANSASPNIRFRAAELAPQTTGSVRNVQPLDGPTILCSVGNSLAIVNDSERSVLNSASPSPIIKIVPDDDRLFIIHEDGSVATMDRRSRNITGTQRYGGDLCAAGALPWLDSLRLLLACASGPIDCVGTDDSLVTRFNSAYRGFREITASADWVAAVSPDRQRLVLWNSWNGGAPTHDLHLVWLTRHRIADIAFA